MHYTGWDSQLYYTLVSGRLVLPHPHIQYSPVFAGQQLMLKSHLYPLESQSIPQKNTPKTMDVEIKPRTSDHTMEVFNMNGGWD